MKIFRYFAYVSVALLGANEGNAESEKQSAQQIYNVAQDAYDKGDWAEAIKGFERVVKPDDGGPIGHSQAIIRARLAQAYAALGDADPALVSANIALRGLGPDEVIERSNMWMAVAQASRFQLDIVTAVIYYNKVIAEAEKAKMDDAKVAAEIGEALALMTVDPKQSAALMSRQINDPANTSTKSKFYLAQLNDFLGRATLNMGDPRGALHYFEIAGKQSGGLETTKINHVQQAIRGDAAIAAQLKNDSDLVREYLTFTGAGHLPSEGWANGIGDSPVCGGEAELDPKDVAVVEFSIANDGHVLGAVPIYASRPGTMGLAFAKAVREWHWNPALLAGMNAFWRDSIRLEMRCTTRPKPQKLSDLFIRDTVNWLTSKGVPASDILAPEKTKIDDTDPRLSETNLSSIWPLYLSLVKSVWGGNGERIGRAAQRLDAALTKNEAPDFVRALVINLEGNVSGGSPGGYSSRRAEWLAESLAPFEARYPQSRSAAWLNLEYAIALETSGRLEKAKPILEHVLSFPSDRVEAHDPIRVVATLHLAAQQKRSGDEAGATALVAAAGISRAQCSVVDVRPVPRNNDIASSEFPSEALRWGFEGYVRESFDINADGGVDHVRTIISYPPFVFGPATEKSVAKFRYIAPFIDGTAAGCDGQINSVRYVIPH